VTRRTLNWHGLVAGPRHGSRRVMIRNLIAILIVLGAAGCGAINPGKFLGIQHTDSDEQYYLIKRVCLTAGSTAHPRTFFDHTMQDAVHLVFVPATEPNHYVTKTIWYDPDGHEFRTIRQTHDKQAETARGFERPKGGTTQIHMMPLAELYKHKPGLWKVELYIDNKLARRLSFTVR
jgi:hypothetical protein